MQAFRKQELLMGNRFELSVVADDEYWANEQVTLAINEIKRIEAKLSTYKEDSETNLINRLAGIEPVQVSDETFQLIERSIRISSITQGAFDITYGSLDKSLWNFDRNMKALPSAETAKQMIRLINYKNILLDKANKTVFLKEKGMRIGFGGIGKGYAAQMAKSLLIKNGVTSGVVNASGDLATWGFQPDGKKWTIGIAHPDVAKLPFSYLEISDMAVATSGNYEKFVLIDGKKYSHTIDPKTGLPITGIKSVTVISPNAEISDALATPVTIMGIEKGLYLIDQLTGVECIVIDDDNKLYTSKNIKLKENVSQRHRER
ncbi:FAD:protein FMN transferase [Ferruginibacter albus]|uniref:FAD:protein FMN transferase n=1 Tax=Ferruginibacter albus TaxID=2875540 RepID=UPI001CC4732C|nr:FAD:protein FMN transferase [Ferruginibacter albus]UAY50993.1 FAD:protein FMN transferase [Ferruginibacter albus]